jgi:KDO2-lipid IV(A) lauroyltransferase
VTARALLALVRLLAWLPLPVLRALGAGLGGLLYRLAASRRRVVQVNLRLCFPAMPSAERERVARAVFRVVVQSWLDRGWLWQASEATLRQRLRWTPGSVERLAERVAAQRPIVLFAPHFAGLDAAWTALALQFPQQPMVTLYGRQSNRALDAWFRAGRARLGRVRLVARHEGVREAARALKSGEWLYLLPDMDLGARESVFVPFFGVSTATVPSLARFAQLGGAQVLPVIARLVPEGYRIDALPAWDDVPSGDALADTARMNERLAAWITPEPAQYYWVHKRFKTRPPGEPPPGPYQKS